MHRFEHYIRQHFKLKHFHLVAALVDQPNVSKVAATMHVTQPAVSKMISEIESGLGVPLFERDGRGIRPTAYGVCLARYAREMLQGIHRAGVELGALADGITGRVAIGMHSVAAPVLIPQGIKLLKERWPNVTVAVQEGLMNQHLLELRAGRLDVVVGRFVKELAGRGLEEEALFEDPLVIVVAATHPLARQRKTLWQDLNGLPWILPPEGSPMNKRLLTLLAQHGVATPGNCVESGSLLTDLPLLLSYPFLGLFPQSLARHHTAAKTLHILPLSLGNVLGPVGMIWSSERPLSPAAKSFIDCLRAVGQSIGANKD